MVDYELEAQILLDSIRKDKTRAVNNKSKKKNSRDNSSSNRSRSRSRGRDKKKEDTLSELNDILQNDVNKVDDVDNAKDVNQNQGVPSRISATPSMQHNPILVRRKSASPSLSVSPARTLSTCPESSTEDDSSSSSISNSSIISKSYSRSNTNSSSISNSSSSSSDSEIDYNTSYRITGLSESDTTRSTCDSKITPNSKARSFGISTLMSDGTPVSNSRTSRLLRGEQMKSIRQEMISRQSTSSSYISGQSKVSGNKKVDESWRSASGYNMSECGGLDGTIHPKASSRRKGRSKSPLISSMTSEGGSGLKSIHTPTPCELYDRLDRSGGSNKEGSGSSSVGKETSSVTTGTTSSSTTASSSSSSSGRVSTSSFSSSGRHSLDKTNHSLYDSSSLDRANRSMSTLTKSIFSTPIRRHMSGKHSKSTKKKNNLTKKKRVLQRSPNSSLSSSQVATLSESQIFNYWESHRIGVVPGIEVSETSQLNSAKSNNKSRRNSFKDLLLRRETELDKERRKDAMIRLDGIKEENHHDYHRDNYQADEQYHNGEDTALVSYSAEYTLKDDKENQITKSMNRIIEDDPTMVDVNSHQQPAHTQSYIYFVLFLSSMICILSYTTPKTISISTYSTIDKTTLSCLIISICLSFITSIVLKFNKTRRYMVKRVKLETSSMRIEFKSIVSLVSIVLLIVWTIISGTILFDVDTEAEYKGEKERQIPNANLYFSTWVSFCIASWLFADRCVYSSDTQSRNQVRRTTQQNDISKGWILNFFCSILLIAFCESTRNHACNTDDLLEESTSLPCEQLHLGVVFGSLGIVLTFFNCGVRTLRSYRILQSIDMYNIEDMAKLWDRRVDLVSCGLSILNILLFALNVEYLTSQTSARLGSEMSNIYICSWICFGVSVYLLLKHVDIIKNLEQSSIELPQQERARVSNEPDKRSYAGGSSSRIPLIHKMINCRHGHGSKAMSAFTDEDSYEYDEESGGWNTSQTTSYSSSSYSNESEESEVSTITPGNFRQPNSTEELNGHGGRPTYYYEDDGNLTIDFHGQRPTTVRPPRTNFEYQHQQPRQHDVPMRPDPTGTSPSSSLESQDVYQILKQQGTKPLEKSLDSQIGLSNKQRQKKHSKSIPRSYPISKSKPTPPSSQSSSSQSSSSSSKSTHGSIDANFVNSIRSASWRRAESLQFEENELYQPVKDSNNGPVLGRRESLVSDPEVNLLIKTLKSERGVCEASDKSVDGSDQDDDSSSNVSYLPHNNEGTDSIEDTTNTQTVTPKLISTKFSKEGSKDTEPTAASTVCSTTMCSISALDTSASTRDTGISAGPLTVASSCSPITEDGSIEMFFKKREKQRKSIKKNKKKVQRPDEDDMSDISDESNGQKLVDQLLAQAQQKRRKPKSKRGEKRVNEVLKQAELRAHHMVYS